MNLHSVEYIIFLLITVFLYYLFTNKYRKYVLIIFSMIYCVCFDLKTLIVLLLISILTYIFGLIVQYSRSRRFTGGGYLIFLVLLLLYYKNILSIFPQLLNHLPENNPLVNIVAPVGISYYIFSSISYIADIKKRKIKAEKNIFNLILFLAFFPKFVAGPIERPQNLLKQIQEGQTLYNIYNIRKGILQILFGFFVKLVISDNIALIVNPIFDNYINKFGSDILFASLLYAVQIYADFMGYTYIAIGSARMFGIQLLDNFKSPYLAKSVSEFWRRWHISLTTWFTEYIYIPLGGNRKGKIRQCINTLVVFGVSGLWHGAHWNYIAWGLSNGVLVILEKLLELPAQFIKKHSTIEFATPGFAFIKRIIVFLCIDFTWIFFRAPSFRTALQMIRKIFCEFNFPWIFSNEILGALTAQMVLVLGIAILLLLAVDIIKYYEKDAFDLVLNENPFFRWGIYLLMITIILVFGGYGNGYQQTQFIYFQF